MKIDRDPFIIKHLYEYCEKMDSTIRRFGNDYDIFASDEQYQMAIAFNLVQIGEMIYRLSDTFKNKYDYIPWKAMRGFRNRVVHEYASLDLAIIWQVVKQTIPVLANLCKKAMNDFSK